MNVELLLEISIGIAAFFVLFLLIGLLFRYTSYWNRIERLYSVKERPQLKLDTRIESIVIETPVDPGGFLNRFSRMTWIIGATASGVYLAALLPLSLVFRPVLVPWAEIAMTGLGRTELSLLELPNVTILLRPEMARRLIGHFESELPGEYPDRK